MNTWMICLRVACLAALIMCGSGCRTIYPGRMPNGPKPCIPECVPRELAKVAMPEYIIEPPDVLTIEAISLIPLQPYFLRPLDVVNISSTGLTEDVILAGDYLVQPNGTIQLGYTFGTILAVGKTVAMLQMEILQRLKSEFREPNVWITLSQMAAQQQIAGEHLVAPDGRVNLGTYGRVPVLGMTIDEARNAIETHLLQYLQNPEIALDVVGYNSKVFYVIAQGAGLGDRVVILPVKGNETVLDAIGQVQGLESNSSTRMWVARPGTNQCGGDQILPVDWLAITQRGDVDTNYQLLAGDRLYVSEDKLVAVDTAIAKIISPIERMMGITLLGTSTVSEIVFFEQQGLRGGFP